MAPKGADAFVCCLESREYLFLLGLLGQENSLDVGEDTTLSDGDTGQKLVQLLVVADSQLQVTGDDSGLLVVTSGVACELEHLSGQVLENGSQINWSTSSDSLAVVAGAQQAVHATDWKLQSCSRRPALRLRFEF